MTADRVSLNEGYEGALQGNKNIAQRGEDAQGLSKKQHNATGELLGQNKGSFATQAGNGSTATANTLSAGSLMHTNNAAGGSEYLRRTAGHEENASHGQAGESRQVETAAGDLAAKINKSS